MTIAISLKVNDGVVLASDSAATLLAQGPSGPSVVQVYDNANKVFNLRKGLPIGAITWGSGAIGHASTSTLIKDLRARFSGDPAHKDWHVDPQSYSIATIAERLKTFIYDENYVQAFKDWPQKPELGFIVAGYSAGSQRAEEYTIRVDNQGTCSDPTPVRAIEQCGATWNGEPEAISRLLLGYSPRLRTVLLDKLGVDPAQIDAAMQIIQRELAVPVINDAMPIQDAIDLAGFLVHLTEKYSRYTPGAPTVGGPIEIAAITKHEGFKWVQRKYYFTRDLNPPEVPNA
ncbi:MAG: hypothetical protein AABO58_13720 [Acidobacteriota bacterium]